MPHDADPLTFLTEIYLIHERVHGEVMEGTVLGAQERWKEDQGRAVREDTKGRLSSARRYTCYAGSLLISH